MAAVAQRRIDDTRQQTTVTETRKVRRARPRRAWARYKSAISVGVVGLAIAMLFGWMSVYAKLAVMGFSRSELMSQYKQEQLKNQRLKLKLDSLTCPESVVAAAQKAGMVYASEYEYVGKPSRVASAGKGVGD